MFSVKDLYEHDVGKLTLTSILSDIKDWCQLAAIRVLGIGWVPWFGLRFWRSIGYRHTKQKTSPDKIEGAEEDTSNFPEMLKGLHELFKANVAASNEVIALTNELIASKDELLASKDELLSVQERYIAAARSKMAAQDAAMSSLEDAFGSCQNLVHALLDLPVFRNEVGEEFRERLQEILRGIHIEDASESDSDYGSDPEEIHG